MNTPADHNALIALLGGPPKVAEALGIESINVRQWRSRNRIPPEHWAPLIAMANDPAVNADWFLETMPERKPPTPAQPATESPESPPAQANAA